MRVAFITAGMVQGGGQRVIAVLANELIHRGHEVSIIVTGSNRGSVYRLEDSIKIHYLKDWLNNNPDHSMLRRIQKRLLKPFKKDDEFSRIRRDSMNGSYNLTRFFRANPFDFAVSFLVFDNMILAPCAGKQNAKVVISEGTFPDRPEYSEAYKKVRNNLYANADIRVFQTDRQKDLFPTKIQKNSVVIGNPLSEQMPAPYFGERRKEIVNFCRLDAPKNLKLLLDAFSLLVEEYSEYQLKIYGDGPLRDEMQKYIEKLGLENNAFLLPFHENIHEIIKDAAMFVTSSDYEGLSNSLMEAMALGMPVIATDCLGGGAAALIIDGKNGFLVPRGDVQSLYRAMKRYIDDPETARICSNNAYRIWQEYSIEIITEKWLNLMRKNN